MGVVLNLDNRSSIERISIVKNNTENLRGGFGTSDPVGSSYENFYSDNVYSCSKLESHVQKIESACNSVGAINPDNICRQGMSLVSQVKSYPLL